MSDLRTAAQQALEACEQRLPLNGQAAIIDELNNLRAALAQQAEPVLQTCNCRWDGDVQVQQCTLHEAHVDAIHEWAERAKVAERKLAQQAEPVAEARYDGTLRWLEPHGVGLHRIQGPLFTAPPQRKPLTEEEIAAEWQKASECASKSEAAVTTSQFVQMFARAVERAHGIGEGA